MASSSAPVSVPVMTISASPRVLPNSELANAAALLTETQPPARRRVKGGYISRAPAIEGTEIAR
eukprot:946722-Prorocentrum_minimum.AAC.1